MTQSIPVSRGQRGFTLVELITVMIVISILAVVALPNFSLLSGYDEIGYRDQVKATLEFTRKAAVAQRRYACVSRSGNTLAVTIDKSSPEGQSASACPREQALALPGDSDNSIYHATATLGGATSVVFDAQGRPFAAAQFTVGASTVITVEAETGYVHH